MADHLPPSHPAQCSSLVGVWNGDVLALVVGQQHGVREVHQALARLLWVPQHHVVVRSQPRGYCLRHHSTHTDSAKASVPQTT